MDSSQRLHRNEVVVRVYGAAGSHKGAPDQFSRYSSQEERIEIANPRRAGLSLRAQIGNLDALALGQVARTSRAHKSDDETVEVGRVSA